MGLYVFECGCPTANVHPAVVGVDRERRTLVAVFEDHVHDAPGDGSRVAGHHVATPDGGVDRFLVRDGQQLFGTASDRAVLVGVEGVAGRVDRAAAVGDSGIGREGIGYTVDEFVTTKSIVL